MALFRRPWVRAVDGGYSLRLPDGLRQVLPRLSDELGELLASDEASVRRVFPTAYPDDAEREAGYQALIRGELVDRHRAGLALLAATADAEMLSQDELTRWMTTINAVRLILGTALDVAEDHELELDDDDPRQFTFQLFTVLGLLLGDIVEAFDDT